MAPLIVALVLAIFAIVLVASAVRIVRQSHVGMIERFGKYRATLSPGLHIVIPFFDRMRVVVDMRETVQPFAPQPVITEDNVTIAIDTVVYFQVTDAFRATYEVANFLTAMEQLAQTTLRNLVGAMTLEETLTSRDQINTQLREVLDEATEKWGVRVTRVELKSIDPPRSIQEAMEQQMRADRAKRATILQAEGEKQSAILRAEGARQAVILGAEADQQSLILRAEGDRQSRALRARGEAEALEHVFDMVKKANILPSDMLGYKYLEALPAVAAGDANKLLLRPSGASDGMGAVAGLGAAFAQGAAPDREPEAPRRAPRQRSGATPPPDEEPPLPERRG
jgi:regulator of protease activity HflC (stomatin/prohibitin superfamily)